MKKKEQAIAEKLQEYGIDADVSTLMASYLRHGRVFLHNAIEVAQFDRVERYVSTCGRGCCQEQRGFLYQTTNQQGEFIELTDADFDYILR